MLIGWDSWGGGVAGRSPLLQPIPASFRPIGAGASPGGAGSHRRPAPHPGFLAAGRSGGRATVCRPGHFPAALWLVEKLHQEAPDLVPPDGK